MKNRKHEEEHQNSSSYANNKYDVQLCKKNAAKSFLNETFPNLDDSAELGKYVLNFYLCYYIYIHLYSSYFNWIIQYLSEIKIFKDNVRKRLKSK